MNLYISIKRILYYYTRKSCIFHKLTFILDRYSKSVKDLRKMVYNQVSYCNRVHISKGQPSDSCCFNSAMYYFYRRLPSTILLIGVSECLILITESIVTARFYYAMLIQDCTKLVSGNTLDRMIK